MLTHECKGNASYKHLSIKQENIDLYYKNKPRIFATVPDFAKFVKSGKVRFKEVDISTPQGEKIADKYRVSWSSLYVNGWNNGKEKRNDLTRMGFKYARNNTAQFKTELKKKINQLLK